MLVSLLSSQYARFAALAEAWLAMGAIAFGVYQENRPLVYWPAGHRLAKPSIVASIMNKEAELGDLRVAGISGLAFEQRLRADADLISYILQLEGELQLMTADLMTSQDQQLALYRLTKAMLDHVTVQETLEAVVVEAMRIIRAQAGYAMFVPASGQEPLLVQKPAEAIPVEAAWQFYWQAQTSESPIVLGPTDKAMAAIDALHLLHIPIRVRGTVMAGLGLLDNARSFEAPDIKLARAITDQASAQVERMLLYQEMFDQAKMRTEMELARRVQIDLLPQSIPQVAGIDIYASSRPASQVGGDFYDFIVQEGRPFIFSIGDVTGKGLSAALLMTMTRSAIHSKAQFMPYPTPEAVMRQSNEDLYNDFTRVGVFATAFVGQYEPSSTTLLYANAGHAPVIYRPHDSEIVLLRADSTALGILPVTHCRNQQLRLGPNDLLLAATDGFTDVCDADENILGLDRMIEIVDALHERSPKEIASLLFEETDRFGQGHPQDDDQTLIVIKGAAS